MRVVFTDETEPVKIEMNQAEFLMLYKEIGDVTVSLYKAGMIIRLYNTMEKSISEK